MIMETRLLKLPYELIKKCIEDEEVLNAYALAITIKKEKQNSLFCKFSLNKLTALLHTNFRTAKKSLDKAVELGIVEIRTYTNKKGETHQDIFVPPFKGSWKKYFKLCINQNNFAYLESEYEKKNRLVRKTEKTQTFKNIKDLILQIFIAEKADSFNKAKNRSFKGLESAGGRSRQRKINRISKQADIREHNHVNRLYAKDHPFEEDEVTLQNSGLSYKTLSSWVTGGYVSKAQIARLVRIMRKNGLVKTRRCASIFMNNGDDTEAYERDPDRFMKYLRGFYKTEDEDGNMIDARKRTFVSGKGRRDVLKLMANLIIPTNCILSYYF